MRVLQRSAGGSEKQVFALRKTIRHHYRQVIYLDLAFAAENEVEQALWKYVFYKQIEELRKLLKLVHTHTTQPSRNTPLLHRPAAASPHALLSFRVSPCEQHAPSASSPTSSSLSSSARPLLPVAGVLVGKEHSDRYARLSTFFRQFLRDSKKFYRSLLNYHLKVAKIHRVGGKFRDLLVKARRRVVDDEDDVFDDEDEDDEEDADVEADASQSGNGSDHESGDGHDSFNNMSNDEQMQQQQQPASSSFSAQAGGPTSSSSFTSSTVSVKAYSAVELHTMHLALLTCHRSLIFLGDLERYSQLILGPSPDQPSSSSSSSAAGDKQQGGGGGVGGVDAKEGRDARWSKAERYYRWALTIMACNGNPHNQLAVVATYKQNNLLAVHRYFRSIAVAQPFSTAMQNLKLLFDKQVQLHQLLHAQHAQHHPHQYITCDWYDHAMPNPKTVDTFIVHLLDVLYTQRNVDSGTCLIHNTVQRIEHSLLNAALLSSPHHPSPSGSLNVYCLQLLLNAIFCVHQHVPNTQIITSDGSRDEEQKSAAVVSPAQSSSGSTSPVPRAEPPLPLSFFSEATSGSLSFLFLFDLLRAFMSSMSLGQASSLHRLGIVGLWCDWLQLHPSFIDPLPIFSSPHSPRSQPSDEPEKPAPSTVSPSSSTTPGSLPSSPFLEHQRLIRTRCWQAFAALCNAVTLAVDSTAQDVVDAVSLPDQPPLKEELEVYAFSYVSQAYLSLTHDFYYRRSDPQSIAELTGQAAKEKETHSPPSISPSTVLGGGLSFSTAAKVSPSLLPTSKLGKDRPTGAAGLDKKQYRRAMKVLRFAQFLLRGHAVLKQDAQTGRFYVDTDIHEAPIITPAASAIIRQQLHQHQQHTQQQQMAFMPTAPQPTAGLSMPQNQPGASQGGSRTSQSLQATSLAGGRGGAVPPSHVRGLIPTMNSAATARTAVPNMAGASVTAGGHLLGMPSHHQQPGAYLVQQQQQMAGMRGVPDDFSGSAQQRAGVKRSSNDRAGSSLRAGQGGHLMQVDEAHAGWRDANAATHQQPYDSLPLSRAGRASQPAPAVSAPHRPPSSDFSSLPPYGVSAAAVDDEMDIDAVLERRMEEEKRRHWRDSEQEQAQNQQTFDLPLASPSSASSSYTYSHVKGLIPPPRSSTSNPNLSSLHRSANDSLAINTADLSSSTSRSRPSTSNSLAFPEPISAGATVGKTSPAGQAEAVQRDSSGSPGAEFRHFHYSAAPGPRGSAPSQTLNGRASDGWEAYNAGGAGGGGGSALQAAAAQLPLDESAEPSASSSRGWHPFSSQSAFSFLHQPASSSLFAQPSASLQDFEQQQQSIFEQQRREQLHNQPGAAELERHSSPSSRSPSPALPQQPAASSPDLAAQQPGYVAGQPAPGPPGFRGGGLISATRPSSSSSSAVGRGSFDGGGTGMVGGPSGLYGASSSPGLLREGGGGGLLGSRAGAAGGGAALPLQSALSSAWAGSVGSVGQGLSDAYSRSLHYPAAASGRSRLSLDDGGDGRRAEHGWPSSDARDERSSRIEDDIGLDDLLSDDQEAHDLHTMHQQQMQRERYQQPLPQSHAQPRRPAAAATYGGSAAAPSPSATRSAAPSPSPLSSSAAAAVYRPPHLQHREHAQPQPYEPYPAESSKPNASHRSSSSSHFAPYPGQASPYSGGHSGTSTQPSSSSSVHRSAFPSSAVGQQPQQPRFAVGGPSSSSPTYPAGSGGQRQSR